MRLLLDTHALLWWAADDPALSRTARAAIADADEVYLSAVSAYEVVLKFSLGRLPGADALVHDFPELTRGHALKPLAISLEHAAYAGRLPLTHRDPFDRLLIAQAVLENVTLVSNERLFDSFGGQPSLVSGALGGSPLSPEAAIERERRAGHVARLRSGKPRR